MERTPPFSAAAKRNAVLASLFAIPPILLALLLVSGNFSIGTGTSESAPEAKVEQAAE